MYTGAPIAVYVTGLRCQLTSKARKASLGGGDSDGGIAAGGGIDARAALFEPVTCDQLVAALAIGDAITGCEGELAIAIHIHP